MGSPDSITPQSQAQILAANQIASTPKDVKLSIEKKRLKIEFSNNNTHDVAIRILTSKEEENLKNYGATGAIGWLTGERHRWKPLTIQNEKGEQITILVNVNSAIKRLKCFAKPDEIIKSLNEKTLVSDIYGEFIKQKIRENINPKNKHLNEASRILLDHSEEISSWVQNGEITESDLQDLEKQLKDRVTTKKFTNIENFKEEFLINRRITNKLEPVLKNLRAKNLTDADVPLRQVPDFLICVHYLSKFVVEKTLTEDDINDFIAKKEKDIEKIGLGDVKSFKRLFEDFILKRPLEPIKEKLDGEINLYTKWLNKHKLYEPENASELKNFMSRLETEASSKKRIGIEFFDKIFSQINAENTEKNKIMEKQISAEKEFKSLLKSYKGAIEAENDDCIKILVRSEATGQLTREELKKFLEKSSSIESSYNNGETLKKALEYWKDLSSLFAGFRLHDDANEEIEQFKAYMSCQLSLATDSNKELLITSLSDKLNDLKENGIIQSANVQNFYEIM